MLGDKIKALRRENNLTQSDLAQRLNVAQGAVAMWETNKRTPDLEMLKKISSCFSVSVDYLIGNQSENIGDDLNNKGFFRLKKGLEPYDISENDADFLLSVYKAHIESNK